MESFLARSVKSREDKTAPLKEKGKIDKKLKRSKLSFTPWVEKYRPENIDEVAYQDEVVAVLRKSLETGNLTHLLFYGSPGTGKTSTILAMAKQLFGHDMFRQRVLELNASDERGIQVVRDKVKSFSHQAVSSTRPDGKPCPPFKIVILDEADSMTNPAQAALRRVMEKESRTTRFCLICNYISRIIDPITSRCSKFRFKPLSDEILEKKLVEIAEKENVICDENVFKMLIKISEGDMRKAITYLQSAHRLKGGKRISSSDIVEMAGVIPDAILEEVIETCYSNSYHKLDANIKDIIAEGFAGSQIISQLHDIIVTKDSLNDNQKSVIIEKIAVVDKCLIDGADEYLQIMALCSTIMVQVCSNA